MSRANHICPTAGFTLIELLVVISIIGLMSSVVLGEVNRAKIKAKHAATLNVAQQYRNAILFAYFENGEYPDPGDTSNYYCLGDYADDQCGWRNVSLGSSWSAQESSSVQSTLASHMPSIPGAAPERSLPMGFWLWEYRGPIYACMDRDADGACTQAYMAWVEREPEQSCLDGQVSSGSGFTVCSVEFK